jgi:hypothetical protein
MNRTAGLLTAALSRVAPVISVSIPDPANRATWIVEYGANCTAAQKEAAEAIIVTFNVNAVDSITNYQARAALIASGHFDTVNAYMQAQPAQSMARQAWEYANTYQRNSEFIAALGPLLGFTPAQIDDLFTAAAQVK